jgi:hypothetical protein
MWSMADAKNLAALAAERLDAAKEIAKLAPTWEPTAEGETIIGRVVSMRRVEQVRDDGSVVTPRVVTMTLEDGTTRAVWECAILSPQFDAAADRIKRGALVAFRYDGRVAGKNKKRSAAKMIVFALLD